jgi:hypothetical protein
MAIHGDSLVTQLGTWGLSEIGVHPQVESVRLAPNLTTGTESNITRMVLTLQKHDNAPQRK